MSSYIPERRFPPCAMTMYEHGRSPGCNMKVWALRDSPMTSQLGLEMTLEVNPKHAITTELENKALVDIVDKTVTRAMRWRKHVHFIVCSRSVISARRKIIVYFLVTAKCLRYLQSCPFNLYWASILYYICPNR